MDNGPKNWGCGTDMSNITVESCQFAQDYLAFIALLRTLGPSPGQAPVIYLAAPPPSCSTAALAQIRRSSTACSPSSSP